MNYKNMSMKDMTKENLKNVKLEDLPYMLDKFLASRDGRFALIDIMVKAGSFLYLIPAATLENLIKIAKDDPADDEDNQEAKDKVMKMLDSLRIAKIAIDEGFEGVYNEMGKPQLVTGGKTR